MATTRSWIPRAFAAAHVIVAVIALDGGRSVAARPVEKGASAAEQLQAAPMPQPTVRAIKPATTPSTTAKPAQKTNDPAAAQALRLKRINSARSWGYQLTGMDVQEAAGAPFDLLVVDATTGLASNRHLRPSEVEHLKSKPDGNRRIVVSYLSIGEAEDYRPDYFSPEYMTEDAPDWLGFENPQWKGNRLIRFCHDGWQTTILGDEKGRSVYNSIDPSPLYRLIELGFDGIYLDRVDVYSEVGKDCPDSRRKMIDFVARLAAHARKSNPSFIVILQNAEELVRDPKMMNTIDAIAKEDLFYGSDHSQNLNSGDQIEESLAHLKTVKAAGRPVFVVDYVQSAAKKADARRRIEQQGFIPYIGPRNLGKLWLPGRDF